MTLKRYLIRLYQLGRQFGLDPRRFLCALGAMPAFVRDYRRFRRGHMGSIYLTPQLHDRPAEGGATKSEYFWQDLIVARWINEAGPEKHVAVGSRIDGFVAHVASFREIEVFDVRPVSAQLPNVTFKQADLMVPTNIEPLIAGGVLRFAVLPPCTGAFRTGPLRRPGGCTRLQTRPGPSGGTAARARHVLPRHAGWARAGGIQRQLGLCPADHPGAGRRQRPAPATLPGLQLLHRPGGNRAGRTRGGVPPAGPSPLSPGDHAVRQVGIGAGVRRRMLRPNSGGLRYETLERTGQPDCQNLQPQGNFTQSSFVGFCKESAYYILAHA